MFPLTLSVRTVQVGDLALYRRRSSLPFTLFSINLLVGHDLWVGREGTVRYRVDNSSWRSTPYVTIPELLIQGNFLLLVFSSVGVQNSNPMTPVHWNYPFHTSVQTKCVTNVWDWGNWVTGRSPRTLKLHVKPRKTQNILEVFNRPPLF